VLPPKDSEAAQEHAKEAIKQLKKKVREPHQSRISSRVNSLPPPPPPPQAKLKPAIQHSATLRAAQEAIKMQGAGARRSSGTKAKENPSADDPSADDPGADDPMDDDDPVDEDDPMDAESEGEGASDAESEYDDDMPLGQLKKQSKRKAAKSDGESSDEEAPRAKKQKKAGRLHTLASRPDPYLFFGARGGSMPVARFPADWDVSYNLHKQKIFILPDGQKITGALAAIAHLIEHRPEVWEATKTGAYLATEKTVREKYGVAVGGKGGGGSKAASKKTAASKTSTTTTASSKVPAPKAAPVPRRMIKDAEVLEFLREIAAARDAEDAPAALAVLQEVGDKKNKFSRESITEI
jgi:hypothetical protein